MPTEAFTGAELGESRLLLGLLMTLDKNDDCDDALEDALLLAASEPLPVSYTHLTLPTKRIA